MDFSALKKWLYCFFSFFLYFFLSISHTHAHTHFLFEEYTGVVLMNPDHIRNLPALKITFSHYINSRGWRFTQNFVDEHLYEIQFHKKTLEWLCLSRGVLPSWHAEIHNNTDLNTTEGGGEQRSVNQVWDAFHPGIRFNDPSIIEGCYACHSAISWVWITGTAVWAWTVEEDPIGSSICSSCKLKFTSQVQSDE